MDNVTLFERRNGMWGAMVNGHDAGLHVERNDDGTFNVYDFDDQGTFGLSRIAAERAATAFWNNA